MDEHERALWAKAESLCRHPALRAALWRHHRYRALDARAEDLVTRIHPQDQMLRHSLRHFQDVNYSVSQYFAVALQQHDAQQQLVRLALGERTHSVALLDFACGFGRSLRFLTRSSLRADVWASDVQKEAVDFVAEAFGVHGIHSAYEPDAFRPGRTFDFIWVASLFSHLPARLFHAWLGRLAALLSPGGVLCFSVHDECLLAPGAALDDEGIHYLPMSEIEELDNRAYGTTHVGERFVAEAIARAFGHAQPRYVRLPRGLANEQDLYVAAREPTHDLALLARFRKGAWGFADPLRIIDGQLYLLGWAASLDDGPIASVVARIDGEPVPCLTGVARSDVMAVLGDARFSHTGWELVHPLPRPEVFLEVSATTGQGEQALLYAGVVGAA